MDDPDISAGIHFCHVCKRKTSWHGTQTQTCEVCAAEFPCAESNCTHTDCLKARIVYGPRDWTDLFAGLE